MREGESPRQHLDRITNQVEILKGMGITVGENEELAKEDAEYKASFQQPEDLTKAVQKWKDKYLAICYLSTLDKRRYGSMIEDLENNFFDG